MDRKILFKCRRTGTNVQHWLTEAPDASYATDCCMPVPCPACASMHLVNLNTGKLLTDDAEVTGSGRRPRGKAGLRAPLGP